jgi:hypothetical protein
MQALDDTCVELRHRAGCVLILVCKKLRSCAALDVIESKSFFRNAEKVGGGARGISLWLLH